MQFVSPCFQLTQIIADKEKKSNSYQSGKLDSLSDEKVVKIKKFAKDYIVKVLRRLEKSSGHRSSSSHATTHDPRQSHASTSTPRSDSAGASNMADAEINVNDTLDLGGDEGDNDDEDAEGDVDDDEGTGSADPSPQTDAQGPEPSVTIVDHNSCDRALEGHGLGISFVVPSTPPGKAKRSRWDEGPEATSGLPTPSPSAPDSLYRGL